MAQALSMDILTVSLWNVASGLISPLILIGEA